MQTSIASNSIWTVSEYRWARERVHQDMQSVGICNVGLGLPHTKIPTIQQNCLTTVIITFKDITFIAGKILIFDIQNQDVLDSIGLSLR